VIPDSIWVPLKFPLAVNRKEPLKIRRSLVVLTTVGALAVTAAPASARDRDCSDFKSWNQAQSFFKDHGGPKRDPHRLDGDHDGIACERLLY
jgi:Excalibur calcium-binding domain